MDTDDDKLFPSEDDSKSWQEKKVSFTFRFFFHLLFILNNLVL